MTELEFERFFDMISEDSDDDDFLEEDSDDEYILSIVREIQREH